jgi:hypothetical protein
MQQASSKHPTLPEPASMQRPCQAASNCLAAACDRKQLSGLAATSTFAGHLRAAGAAKATAGSCPQHNCRSALAPGAPRALVYRSLSRVASRQSGQASALPAVSSTGRRCREEELFLRIALVPRLASSAAPITPRKSSTAGTQDGVCSLPRVARWVRCITDGPDSADCGLRRSILEPARTTRRG